MSGGHYQLSQEDKQCFHLQITGRLDAQVSVRFTEELLTVLKKEQPAGLQVDLSAVHYLDDVGVLFLITLKDLLADRFVLASSNETVDCMLAVFHFQTLTNKPPPEPTAALGFFIQVGTHTLLLLANSKRSLIFLGGFILSSLRVVVSPRLLRRKETLWYMQKTGVEALPVVGLISFLLGLIMAFMSAIQLQQFGAQIYVASLVGLSMVRELGPIMTAIIVAGRSGSAFAAEIGTMKVSEEIDALVTMGFNTTEFLVLPKVVASVFVVPLLTVFSDFFAVAGGLLVGVFMLDLTAGAYWEQTITSLSLFDVSWGLLKSAIFALLISLIGCLRGFQVTDGAAGVGRATTSAVVSSLFVIILVDSILAVLLRYWG